MTYACNSDDDQRTTDGTKERIGTGELPSERRGGSGADRMKRPEVITSFGFLANNRSLSPSSSLPLYFGFTLDALCRIEWNSMLVTRSRDSAKTEASQSQSETSRRSRCVVCVVVWGKKRIRAHGRITRDHPVVIPKGQRRRRNANDAPIAAFSGSVLAHPRNFETGNVFFSNYRHVTYSLTYSLTYSSAQSRCENEKTR